MDSDVHLSEQIVKRDFSQSAGIRSHDLALSYEKILDCSLGIFFINSKIDIAALALQAFLTQGEKRGDVVDRIPAYGGDILGQARVLAQDSSPSLRNRIRLTHVFFDSFNARARSCTM